MQFLMRALPFALSAAALGLAIGCGGGDEAIETAPASSETAGSATAPPATVTVTADARQEAAQIFQTRCTTCHGPEGKGDGPGSTNLNPKPRNYHDKEWQKSVTDEQIEKTIVYGGTAVGKSPLMAPNPDLASKPAVVAALRERVRAFDKQ